MVEQSSGELRRFGLTIGHKQHKYEGNPPLASWFEIDFIPKAFEMPQRRASIGLRLFAIALTIAAALMAGRAAADDLDAIRSRGTLVWGGDRNGGGPYVYPDEKNPKIDRGFEVDLADLLAESLGVKAVFKQGDWEKVPELIERGVDHDGIDIAMNGYELTSQHEMLYLCSAPYYVYGFQLLVRLDSRIHSWKDLESDKGRPAKIGALVGSAALRYLQDKQKNKELNIQPITYDGTTDSMNRVVDGADDGTLQDDPTAIFYADQFPRLRRVGRPVSQGYYVILMDKHETRLKQAIDAALEKLIDDGELKALYDRWDLSGKSQMLAHCAICTKSSRRPNTRRFWKSCATIGRFCSKRPA